jgi:hypothetical protein
VNEDELGCAKTRKEGLEDKLEEMKKKKMGLYAEKV